MSAGNGMDAGPPHAATVVSRTQESPTIFTLKLRLNDAAAQAAYRFAPGQFNIQIHSASSLFRQGTEVPAMQRGNLEMSTMTTFEVAANA